MNPRIRTAPTASVAPTVSVAPVALLAAIAALGLFTACQVEDKGSAEPAVTTLNPGYDRLHSHVLARRILTATEANLDFAAYSKNIMLADPEWKAVHTRNKVGMDDLHFGSLVEETKAILDFTPLTDLEKSRPMAWTPVLERLLTWNFERTSGLANAYSSVTSERWGDTSDATGAFQEFASLYIHNNGNVKEVWVELEFKPWLGSSLDGIQDRDLDKHPEVLAKLNPSLFTSEMIDLLAGDYSSKALGEPEVMDWARNLASRWYPSYNTDFADIQPGKPWPYQGASETLWKEMGKTMVGNPLFVFRGRPFEDTLYNVFEVEGMGATKSDLARRQEGTPVARGLDKGLTARLEAITGRVDKELKTSGGGAWESWIKKLGPFQAQVNAFGSREAATVQGLQAKDGYLVFRRELEYLVAPDWNGPLAKHKPLAVITALKDRLASQGIDFLFVPVPTKLDLYPEILLDSAPNLPGGIAQPHFRKMLRDLAEARVETVDLLEPFLKLKAASEAGKRSLYQKQDTHWSAIGLETAAQVLADRVKNFSWYDSSFLSKVDYKMQDSVFETLGDIQARLTDAAKAKVGPESQLGHRVLDRDGKPYEDTASSPVLVLGDSYTGVFQSVGCRNAGVTAHLAARLGGPVDLIMGWGGGPEAPQKLAKRGDDYLANKRVVIWMMSARDLFVYPGEWTAK